MKKWVFLIFSVVLVIFLSLGGVYLWTVSKSNSKGFPAIKYYPENAYYVFTFKVGDFISTPIQIKDTKGQVLAVAKISVKAEYTNANGFNDSVTIPLIIQKTNGDVIVFSDFKSTSWSDSIIQEEITSYQNDSNWKKGVQKYIEIGSDLNAATSKNPSLLDFQYLMLDVAKKYQMGREKVLSNFLSSGNSKIGLVIPIYVDRSN